MKQSEIARILTNRITRNAYEARICEHLKLMNFDVEMMKYYEDVNSGKAFGQMEALSLITGKPCDDIYSIALDEADTDAKATDGNIVRLLNLAGFEGQEYYNVTMKYSV